VPLWEESYLGQLRALAGGERVLLAVGTRAVLRDADGRVLLIRRSDNGMWAFPAGTMELGQSLRDCAIREVFEETGLTAHEVTPFAVYSGLPPKPNVYGHTYQHISLACRVDGYSGQLRRETDETTDARFYPLDEIPGEVSASVRPTLADLAAFEAGTPFRLA
jgi:ADP-ribose pyrophosphatase YjhB (NUDIX family)